MRLEPWMMRSAIALSILALFDIMLFCINIVLERRTR